MSIDMKKLLNPTVEAIPPSGIRRFFDIAAEMKDAISLGVGEPDFVTPWHIRDEGIYSLEQGRTYYTSNAGLKELRKEITVYLKRRFQVEYDPLSQVVVTVGGSEAIDLMFRAVLQPGDEVLIPDPSFVCYRPLTALAGGVPKSIVTKAENGFRLTAEDLKTILLDSRFSLYRQYQQFFLHNGTRLHFTNARMDELVEQALLLGTGARALNALVEDAVTPLLMHLAEGHLRRKEKEQVTHDG